MNYLLEFLPDAYLQGDRGVFCRAAPAFPAPAVP